MQHSPTASLLVPKENHIPTAPPRLPQRQNHSKLGQQALRNAPVLECQQALRNAPVLGQQALCNAPVLECGISHYPRMSLPRDTGPKHPQHPTLGTRREMMMMMMMMMSKWKMVYLFLFPCLSPSPSDSLKFPCPFVSPSLL